MHCTPTTLGNDMYGTKLTTLFVLLTLGAGCAAAPAGTQVKDEPGPLSEGGKEDRWNWRNDPDRFDGDFVFELAELPLEGRAEAVSWPSTYWPTFEDGPQVRWQGQEVLSPVELYDQAFNGWVPDDGFMDLVPFRTNGCSGDWDEEYYDGLGPLASHVSRNMGNRRSRDGVDSDGDGEVDECDDNDGLETWWGLCHAWVPASLLENRPLRAVEYNGVTFEVGDIEALLILAYNRAPAAMIGGRCNDGADDDNEVGRDENGRATNVGCRDTNPGSFHVIMTNRLGLEGRGFAMDRTYDYQVWNQPVTGFEVTHQEEIDLARANELLGLTGDTYEYNADAVTFFEVRSSLDWITEAHASTTPANASSYERTDRFHYILELDAAGRIIGGEYIGSSRERHPDFLWDPRPLERSSVPSLDLDQVRMLVEMSRAPEVPTGGTGEIIEVAGTGGVAIPDNNATGITATATVDDNPSIAGLTVQVDITHTYIGDLRVVLSHDGTDYTVHERAGSGADDIHETFTVPAFDGKAAGGVWTLRVSDHAGRDVGTLDGWTLRIVPVTDGSEPTEPADPGTSGPETFDGVGPIAIPDNASAGISSSALVPAGVTGAVSVSVNVTHTWRGDLLVTVEHGGYTRTLHDRTGGGADDLVQTFALDDFSGDPAGDWTLHVSDHAGQDVGVLQSWSVTVD